MDENTRELTAPKTNLEITHDLTGVRTILNEMVKSVE
jgi:hypothetical protein